MIGADDVIVIEPGDSHTIFLNYQCFESHRNWSFVKLTLDIKDGQGEMHLYEMEMYAYC